MKKRQQSFHQNETRATEITCRTCVDQTGNETNFAVRFKSREREKTSLIKKCNLLKQFVS